MDNTQDDINFAVLHAQAKAVKRGDVTINKAQERVYSLSKQDVKKLTELGVTVIEVAGMALELVGDILVERAAPRPDTKKTYKWDTLSIPKRVKMAKAAGLEGKKGSKSWLELKRSERKAIVTALKRSKMQDKPVENIPAPKKTKRAKRPKTKDFLMWVGAKYYPTYHDFVKEARIMGCCKRIGHVLQGIKPGRTRIFLAHDEGLVGDGFIFGYFIVNRIEIVLPKGAELPKGCVTVSESTAKTEPERGCGWRLPGGMYLMSETDYDTLKSIAKELGVKKSDVKGGFVPIEPFRLCSLKHFRGVLEISGKTILSWPETTAPSDDHPTLKHEPEWTAKADKLLLKMVERMTPEMSRARVFKEFALDTGHSKAKVAYRYSKLIQEANQ